MITTVYPWSFADKRDYACNSSGNVYEQRVTTRGGRMYRDQALRALDWNWGDAYDVGEALSVWRAIRRDNGVTLIASDAEELRDLIIDDYSRKPVPRGIAR